MAVIYSVMVQQRASSTASSNKLSFSDKVSKPQMTPPAPPKNKKH